MSDIELVIKIPEEIYNDIQSRDWKNGELIFSEEWKAIHDGIPLNKIRAEIESLQNANPSYWHSGDMVEREEVFEIIDHYKAESEVSDADSN